MMLRQPDGHLERDQTGAITCTTHKNEFQVVQRSKCKKWNDESAKTFVCVCVFLESTKTLWVNTSSTKVQEEVF